MPRSIGSFPLVLFLILSTAAAQQQSAPQKGDVIRITTQLVQTDVTVGDKEGRFVDGLKPEQDELLVDGKPQSISFFERIAAGSEADSTLQSATASETKPTTTERNPSRRRTIFFFVDDMHLSPDSMVRTKEMLKRFVAEAMGDENQVA